MLKTVQSSLSSKLKTNISDKYVRRYTAVFHLMIQVHPVQPRSMAPVSCYGVHKHCQHFKHKYISLDQSYE
jgi:hypothetical protein